MERVTCPPSPFNGFELIRPSLAESMIVSINQHKTYPKTRASHMSQSTKRWKEVRTKRASSVQVKKGTTVEQRSKEKEIKKAYRERMTELKEEIRQNKQEKRRQREEMEKKKKKENVLKSGTKLQKITNPKTLKKISKSKQRKLLKVVSDDVFNNNTKK